MPDYGETYPFSVRGQTILLDSCSLAAALAGLPEQTQEEIFLYYFQHLTQKEIGEQSGWTRSTIERHIQLAQIENMVQALLHARKKIFGASSEKTQMEGQMHLFMTEQELAVELLKQQKEVSVKAHKKTPRKPGVREEMLSGLKKEVVEYLISEEEVCPK